MKTNTSHTISAAIAGTVCLTLTACGGGSDDNNSAINANAAEAAGGSPGTDELGGPGHWTASQLCALSTPDAVSLQFGVEIEERPAIDDADWSACHWEDKGGEPLAQPLMSINNHSGFASDSLGGDEPLDVVGADMATYSANIGGAAHVDAVVGDQSIEITFPVGTEGAREFGTVIAALWAASQA